MTTRGARIPALAVVCLAVFALVRWLQAASTGHLVFGFDAAEVELLRAVIRSGEWTFGQLLFDPQARLAFAVDCVSIADTGLHRTLPLAGLLLRGLLDVGVPLGPEALRAGAIALSSAGLAAGLALGVRCTPEPGRRVRFVLALSALWLFAPAPWFRLSLSYWGTHDFLVAVVGLGLLAALPALERAGSLRGYLLGAAATGALVALALALHTALLIPAAALLAWRVVACRSVEASPPFVALAAALGLIAAAGTWQLLAAWPALVELGARAEWWENDKLDQATWAGAAIPGLWLRAMRSSTSLLPGALAAVWALAQHRRGGKPVRVDTFLAALFAGWWLAAASLGLSFQQPDAPGLPGGFRIRYAAPLFAIGAWLLARWAIRSRWGAAVLAVAVLAAIPGQLAMLQPGRADAIAAHATVRPFEARYGLSPLASGRWTIRDDAANEPWLRGYLLLASLHSDSYWDWPRPTDVEPARLERTLRGHLREAPPDPESRRAYLQGSGAALRVLWGPLETWPPAALDAFPASRDALTAGARKRDGGLPTTLHEP